MPVFPHGTSGKLPFLHSHQAQTLSAAAASIVFIKSAFGFISHLSTGQKQEGAANEQQPWEVTAHIKWGSLGWGCADAVPPRVTINGHMWIQEEAAL